MLNEYKPMDGIQTVTDRVYDILKSRIINGELEPGTRLKHIELAEELGVSPTPVREALGKLESVGLVEYASRKGWSVRIITDDEAKQIYEVREYLEGLSARRLCEHLKPEMVLELEADLQSFEDSFAERAIEGCVYSDMNFHKKIACYAGNNLTISIMEDIFDRIYALRRLDVDLESLRGAIAEHRNILNAIKDRNSDEAELLARHHVRGCQSVIPNLLPKTR